MHTRRAVKCIHCGQLILRKISKIGATRCQILRRLKCTKFDFQWGSLQRFPDPLAVFKEPTFKGRREMGKRREGDEKGMGREGA